MRISTLFVLTTLWLAGTAVAAPLEQILESPHREADSGRDGDRHPAKTLAFFQVEPDMTVVEVWPGGGGWYTAFWRPGCATTAPSTRRNFPPTAASISTGAPCSATRRSCRPARRSTTR